MSTIPPAAFWEVKDVHYDANGEVIAYRLACSGGVFFDQHHKPMDAADFALLLPDEFNENDYPDIEAKEWKVFLHSETTW